nr:hypothetical protein [Mesorhizobium loti]
MPGTARAYRKRGFGMNWKLSNHDLADHDFGECDQRCRGLRIRQWPGAAQPQIQHLLQPERRRCLHLGADPGAQVDRRHPRRRACALHCRPGALPGRHRRIAEGPGRQRACEAAS